MASLVSSSAESTELASILVISKFLDLFLVLFVKKKDRSLHLYIDYRKLNQATIRIGTNYRGLKTSLTSLRTTRVFSEIDFCSGYHQLRVKEGNIRKTVFKTQYGHYEFAVMPFGLTNSPTTFMSLMNTVYHQYLDKFIIFFIDDILVYSNNKSDHGTHLRMTLQILKDNQLYAKLSKCDFWMKGVNLF